MMEKIYRIMLCTVMLMTGLFMPMCVSPSSLHAAEDLHEKIRAMYRGMVDKLVKEADTPAKLYKTINELSGLISIMEMTGKATPERTLETATMAFSLDFTVELMERMAVDVHERESSESSRNALEKIRLCREATRKGVNEFEAFARESGILEMRQLAAALREEKAYALNYYAKRMGKNTATVAPKEELNSRAQNQAAPTSDQGNSAVAGFFQRHTPKSVESAGTSLNWQMTDALYLKLKQDQSFALADNALTATWGILKNNLPKNQFQSVQKQHKEWLASGRDQAAATLGGKLSQAEAYAQATWAHVNELAALVGTQPQPGEYSLKGGSGGLDVSRQDGGVKIAINTSTETGSGVCEYETVIPAPGASRKGWITVSSQEGEESITVMFLFAGHQVRVLTAGADYYCGVGASLDGQFDRR